MKHNFLRLDCIARELVKTMEEWKILLWFQTIFWNEIEMFDGLTVSRNFFQTMFSGPWRSCFRSSHLCVVTEVWPVSWGVLKSCFWFTIQHLRRSMRSSSHQDLVLSSLLEKRIYISNCSMTWRIWLGKHVYKT